MNRNIARTKDGMDDLIDRTRDAVVSAADRAERGVDSAAERVTTEAHAAGEQVRDRARTVSRGAHRRLESAAQAIDQGYARARGDLLRAAGAATDYVTENPGKAVLIAASTGFVLGLLVHRRRRSA